MNIWILKKERAQKNYVKNEIELRKNLRLVIRKYDDKEMLFSLDPISNIDLKSEIFENYFIMCDIIKEFKINDTFYLTFYDFFQTIKVYYDLMTESSKKCNDKNKEILNRSFDIEMISVLNNLKNGDIIFEKNSTYYKYNIIKITDNSVYFRSNINGYTARGQKSYSKRYDSNKNRRMNKKDFYLKIKRDCDISRFDRIIKLKSVLDEN